MCGVEKICFKSIPHGKENDEQNFVFVKQYTRAFALYRINHSTGYVLSARQYGLQTPAHKINGVDAPRPESGGNPTQSRRREKKKTKKKRLTHPTRSIPVCLRNVAARRRHGVDLVLLYYYPDSLSTRVAFARGPFCTPTVIKIIINHTRRRHVHENDSRPSPRSPPRVPEHHRRPLHPSDSGRRYTTIPTRLVRFTTTSSQPFGRSSDFRESSLFYTQESLNTSGETPTPLLNESILHCCWRDNLQIRTDLSMIIDATVDCRFHERSSRLQLLALQLANNYCWRGDVHVNNIMVQLRPVVYSREYEYTRVVANGQSKNPFAGLFLLFTVVLLKMHTNRVVMKIVFRQNIYHILFYLNTKFYKD